MESLWRIYRPDAEWYKTVFVNGELITGPHLPGVACPACGRIGRCDPISCECPPEIQDEVASLGGLEGRVNARDFHSLASRWEATLRQRGINTRLGPGDYFRPTRWRI